MEKIDGQLSIFDINRTNYKITKPIRLIELFGGIGAQAKALENLGVDFEHYRMCEFDKYAVASYNAVHGTNFEPSDITQLKSEDLGIIDTNKYEYIMTYSFPCQDLSLAGKQAGMGKGSNTRSGLLWEVERLLKGCKELPQVLLMENVIQVHSKKNIDDFNKWQEFLKSIGYSNYWQDFNAKNYGIPQNRNRCFMISILGNYTYDFPKEQELKLRLKDLLENEVDEKYYINNIIKIENPQKNEVPKLIGGIGKKTSNGGTQYYQQDRVYDSNSIAMCHPASIPGGSYKYQMHDLKIRKLTPKECWRLMGFDDEDFNKAQKINSNSRLYKQAGNSIVVNVLMAIFKQLF